MPDKFEVAYLVGNPANKSFLPSQVWNAYAYALSSTRERDLSKRDPSPPLDSARHGAVQHSRRDGQQGFPPQGACQRRTLVCAARTAHFPDNHASRCAQARWPLVFSAARLVRLLHAPVSPPWRARTAPQTVREHKLEAKDLPNGLKELTMHIGDHTYPVYLGYNKLPELVAELKKLDLDKVRALPCTTPPACSPARLRIAAGLARAQPQARLEARPGRGGGSRGERCCSRRLCPSPSLLARRDGSRSRALPAP